MKLLVVDDSSTMRRIIKNTLARLDHKDILEAENGLQAWQLLMENSDIEVVTALKAGVNNYIVKPFTPQVLKEKLDDVLG